MASAGPHSPYFGFVDYLANSWPQLSLLSDFASEHVKFEGYQDEGHVENRLTKIKGRILDINESSTERPREFDNKFELEQLVSSHSPSLRQRIIICENISRDVIEYLGSTFTLSPRFFENHLQGLESFNRKWYTGDTRVRVDPPYSVVARENFFTVHFSRPYPFKGWRDLYERRKETHIPRLGSVVTHNVYVRESVSFYEPFRYQDSYELYIILCDPLVDPTLPSELHLRNRDPLPEYGKKTNITYAYKREHVSARSAITRTILTLGHSSTKKLQTAITTSIIEMALDFSAAALEELRQQSLRRTTQLAMQELIPLTNYEIKPFQGTSDSFQGREDVWSYNAMLWSFHASGGMMNLLEVLETHLSEIENISIKRLPQTSERRRILVNETDQLRKTHHIVQQQLNRYLDFLRQDETMNETRRLVRLNMLGSFLVPFSTVAAVLGIQDSKRIWVFIALVLPLLLFSVVIGNWGISIGTLVSTITSFVQSTLPGYYRKILRPPQRAKDCSHNV